jgi:hypothetical protein
MFYPPKKEKGEKVPPEKRTFVKKDAKAGEGTDTGK